MRLPGKKVGIAVAALVFCAAAGAFFRAGRAGEPASALPRLPVVVRSPAAQPQLNLPGDGHLDKTPPRRTVGLDLVKNGWSYNCMECHQLFPAKWHYDRPLNEHRDIQLEHGNNRFCLNCHHPTNRNAFVDYDGAEIAQADVVLLCAKCHGTIYRDWKAGVHGRSNGFWKADRGEKVKLRCIQCHDPHSPKFKPMPPLAPLRYPSRGSNPPAQHQPEPVKPLSHAGLPFGVHALACALRAAANPPAQHQSGPTESPSFRRPAFGVHALACAQRLATDTLKGEHRTS